MTAKPQPILHLNDEELEVVSDDGGVHLVVEKDGNPAVYLEGPYAVAPKLLAACERAEAAFRCLAEMAGDVPAWNEGGVAYEASQTVKAAIDAVGPGHKSLPRVIVEVSGGNVQAVFANMPITVSVLDHDNWEACGPDEHEEAGYYAGLEEATKALTSIIF